MNEYIYKLNLPNIQDLVINENFSKLINDPVFIKKGHAYIPADRIFKKQYLEIKNIQFNMLSVFLKYNATGSIHVDSKERVPDESDPCLWGINWLYNGTGTAEFWKKSNLDSVQVVEDKVGTYNIKCNVSTPPDKIYQMDDTLPYLFNASVPHRASGFGKRYAFSLRATKTSMTWQQVCNTFNELIIVN
jgi:hypothetical protein